jgi:hypothetical protein
MSQNVSEILPTSSSNTNLVKLGCSGNEKVVSLDDGFQVNVYLFIIVNTLNAIFGLLSNSVVIFTVYRDKLLGKVLKALTMLLAIQGVFCAVVIQPLYVASNFIVLANIYNPSKLSYCTVVAILSSGTKLSLGFSIVTMLGITVERYTAVIHPYKYMTCKRSFGKTLLFLLAILETHFVLSDLWTWYKNISKILTALLTFIPYVFTVYAYVKIYFKLRELDKVWGNFNQGTVSRRNSKKKQSLTSLLVVGTYLVCYLPMVITRSLNLDKEHLFVQLYLLPWFTTLLFCSFSVNAVVYGWRTVKMFFLQSDRA